MHNFKNLPKIYKITLLIIFAVLLVIGFSISPNETSHMPPVHETEIVKSTPINFAKAGTITFNNPGQGQNTLYLVYEEPGSPALTKELTMDPLSFCAAPNGALPCVAMSVTFDKPFGGKRVFVEGTEQDGKILVRKLQVIEDGRILPTQASGDIFISWPHAIELIKACRVNMIMQTHGLDIYLMLDNNERVRTVEPVIDEVFQVYNSAQLSCGPIPIATE